jgi:hypothetical protein
MLPANIRYLSQNKSEILSPSDQALLTNVFGAYERIYPKTSSCQYLSFPTIEHSTIHSFFNEYEERHKLLIEYFKLIPEFIRLSINDEVHLMQNHFGGIFGINERIIARSINHCVLVSLKNMFGADLANDLTHVAERIITYTRDPVLLKLVLIIRSLSSGINRYHDDVGLDLSYDDTLLVFVGQSIYVELLWRYLQSRLPSEQDVVKFFNKLILDLLLLQRGCIAVERHICDLDHEIDKMKPLMQSMWPKSERVDNMDSDDIDDESR